MGTLDIILVLVFLVGAVIGFSKGLIKQLASLLGLIIGLVAAKALYAPLADKLCPTVTDNMTAAQILAFVLIWIAVPMAFALVASLLSRALEVVSLGCVNRWLGSGFGALKYVVLASLMICVIEFVDANNQLISQKAKQESIFYYPVGKLAGIFVPVAKHVAREIINFDPKNDGKIQSE